MRRKVVKQGNSALTITLPAEWTKRLNLKAGNEVEIEEQENFLRVSVEKTGEKKVEIDISELNEILVWTYIISAYRKGYDEVKLKFTRQQIKQIQEVVNALLGIAITEQSQESCIVKDLSESTSEKEFANIQRRIFYLLEEMSDSSLAALKQKSKEALRNIEFQDYNINKFSNFCLRIINKRNLSSSLDFVISELENLGDEYARLALDLAEEKSLRVSQELFKLFEEVNLFFSEFHKFYYSFSNKSAVELVNKKEKLKKAIKNLKTKNNEETLIVYHLSKIIHLIINIEERVIMMKI